MNPTGPDSPPANDDGYEADRNTLDDMQGESDAYLAAIDGKGMTAFAGADPNADTIQEYPLPAAKIREFEDFCRRVTGSKLDDFPPGACKRGTRRESTCRVLGPFTIQGKRVFNQSTGEGYAEVICRDGRYVSDSTKENATFCIARGAMHATPQGSWAILVRKSLGQPDVRVSDARKDHDDDYGRHAQIAAFDMCHRMLAYIFDHLT